MQYRKRQGSDTTDGTKNCPATGATGNPKTRGKRKQEANFHLLSNRVT